MIREAENPYFRRKPPLVTGGTRIQFLADLRHSSKFLIFFACELKNYSNMLPTGKHFFINKIRRLKLGKDKLASATDNAQHKKISLLTAVKSVTKQ